MATFRTDPSAGKNGPPGAGQIFYIARFEFRRNAGVQGALPIVASGIATIPLEAFGDWDLANIYTLTYDDQGARKVDAFMLHSRDAQERGVLRQALNKSAQYLVFKTGELVAVEERYKMPLHFLMLESGPLFDEPAIIQMVMEEPFMEDILCTRNSFGTWADKVQARIGEMITLAIGWRTVGDNAALMPTTSKLLEFTDEGEEHVVFEDDDEE